MCMSACLSGVPGPVWRISGFIPYLTKTMYRSDQWMSLCLGQKINMIDISNSQPVNVTMKLCWPGYR